VIDQVVKPAVAAAVLAVLWTIEWAAPMVPIGRRAGHDFRNLALGIGNAALAGAVFARATLGVTELAAAREFGLLRLVELSAPVKAGLAVVLFDAWQYLWHRLNHRVPLLWRFHAVHHTDRAMDASTAVRFHTGEILASGAVRLAVLPLLGMSVQQLLLYELIVQPVVLFHHSNVAIGVRMDRWLRAVLVTPRMHRMHHSRRRPETDSNYASLFSWWDRAFASFTGPRRPTEVDLGLDGVGEDDWQKLGGMLRMPFRRGPQPPGPGQRS